MKDETISKTNKHWIVLLAASLMFGAWGGIINSSIGVFYSPVSENLGILRGSFAFHSTITLIMIGIVSLFVAPIIERFGWKKTFLVALFLTIAGTSGMAFTSNLFVIYILGAIKGIGAAFFGLVPMALIINNWFYEKNGLAMSIASGTSGVSGMLFAPMFASIIATFDWRTAFVVKGVVLFILLFTVFLIPFKLRPEDEGLLPYGYTGDSNTKAVNESLSINEKKHLKDVRLSFIAMLVFSLLLTNVIGINQHLSSHGENIGMSLQLSGYMLSAVMLGNVTFKLITGPLSDSIGPVRSSVLMIILNGIGLLLLITVQSSYLTIFSAFLYGSIFSVSSVAKPILTKRFFGRRLSEKVYPILTFISSIGGALANTLVGYVYDFTGTYITSFVIGLFFQIVNLLLLYMAYKLSIR